ncbi:long chain base biosynthesis protein, putative [Candida dubliniensis CD36]|uniref:serine C-palmitoyltransferase n=1 Tax=Candida dubliniensis (strain CD36 / ATCC MYA-646 / CBS 7987 / NCPF 3949 / NRRL Y-17841) TaxID=573826 RepID=B9WMP7_CANDC|nr:long chain base biosynthesis protein, putative [Candida dubliniensis CD36]CAX40362.1 long chain base biosynthesis protein, putative [Candida dubliniensis CD36]
MASSIIVTTTTTTTTTTATAIAQQHYSALPLSAAWELLSSTFQEDFVTALNNLEYIPGGGIILRYIKSSYQNDPIRSLLEFCLVLFALSYFLSSKKKENKSELVRFSRKEIDELCDEWEPAPLVNEVTELENWELKAVPEIIGQNGAHVNLNNKTAVNLASQDFLNLNENDRIKESARVEIRSAGVGACGPPNFYGTQDVHVRLEEDLARYLDSEQAIIYGQDFVTAGSVIPAFLKRGDLCVVDSGVNIALQKALIVSRADIEWYDHNDVDHLEQILTQLKPVLDKQKPIRRRFIITEGLFANSGDIANLPRIVELKNKYKYRLFLDESLSIGVLGGTGKGLAEHYGVSRDEISITIGSMANSFASSGGFCVGVNPMVHHQRISSNAYVFSASLPPYSAKVTSQAIREISAPENLDPTTGKSKLMVQLHKKTVDVYDKLEAALESLPMHIVSSPQSPMIHLGLREEVREQLNLPLMYGNSTFITTGKPAKLLNEFDEYLNLESFILQKIIDYVLEHEGILITRSKLILEHENLPVLPPHLLIMINLGVNAEELNRVVEVLPKAIESVFTNLKSEEDLLLLRDELINY